ncbi:MAG: flagellar protein FlgN [Pseudomonadota bacterium]|nr:flagellar protein FlgN [Pseudomonadota bacterium]
MTAPQALASLNTNQFSSQIDELNSLLLEFKTLLESESELLKQNDSNAIIETSQTKNEISNKIDKQVQSIQNLLPDKSKHFFELAQDKVFSGISKTLQPKIDGSIELTQACHDLNMANGMAIQILSNMNQVSLQILTGQNRTETNLYGSSGSTTQNKTKSSLGKA